jgi:hypothetical protein
MVINVSFNGRARIIHHLMLRNIKIQALDDNIETTMSIVSLYLVKSSDFLIASIPSSASWRNFLSPY